MILGVIMPKEEALVLAFLVLIGLATVLFQAWKYHPSREKKFQEG